MLDRALQALTAPVPGSSEAQPPGGEGGQGSEELLELLDVEETEQSKLPQYLERFKVSHGTTESLSAGHETCFSAMLIDKQPSPTSVSHTQALKSDIQNYIFMASHRK